MSSKSYLDRKENLRAELKVQLPVPIDSKKYLIGKYSFQDVFIIAPFIMLSALLMFLLSKLGALNTISIVFASLPTVMAFLGQTMKHSVRKEIPYFIYGVLWVLQYKRRTKEFHLQKGALELSDYNDTRRKIGIKNVYANCYETNDGRFVKVFEMSTINMSLMNIEEQREILNAWKNFMNTLNFVRDIQTSQIAQPVSLEKHIHTVERNSLHEANPCKVLLKRAYVRSMDEDIQKNRDLVTRKRYAVISEKIGTDREKSLNEITTKAQMFIGKLSDVDFGYTNISVKELNNDELIKLMFTCVDYDSAISIGDNIVNRAVDKSQVSMGEVSAKELIETLQRNLTEKIN